MKKIIVGVVFLCLPLISLAQWNDCPYGKTDGSCEYPGECGRYTDTNGDKICDHSQEKPVTNSAIKSQNEETTVKNKISNKGVKNDSKIVTEASDDLNDNKNNIDNQETILGSKKIKQRQNKYPLWNIVLGLSVFYALTYFLAKKSVITMVGHKKIWNILLTISFLVLAVTSVLLIIQVNSGRVFYLGFNILHWHVISGIIMMTITFFHIGWHWRYYKSIFKIRK